MTGMTGLAAVLAGSLWAGVAAAEGPKDFKEAMQTLDQDFRALTSAVMREEWDAMVQAAGDIAHHPRPPLAFRKRVMGILGPEAAGFKMVDEDVHKGSARLLQAAKRKDLEGVMRQYHRVSQGCVDCHTSYRQTIRDGLAEQ
ncbi:MAG TPA: cytochrome c [Gammaproteobacteria bacterium]|nr:cytochrome c [Gammaproteobacteria bacterium]